jgi:hypothetical protein
MPNDRAEMTGWYDPRQLLLIGTRVAEATIFGEMFDRRELMAALDPFDQTYFDANFNFAAPDAAQLLDRDGAFWLDYAADTGDGWTPVHAVARLLARESLVVAGDALPQGRVLVFGGDEVYPTASEHAYKLKLQDPFRSANAIENASAPAATFDAGEKRFRDRSVFAVPGNHDWYDDLTSFTRLFCNKAPDRPGSARSPGRYVCGRETRQTRSYFALRLPHDWWLCAVDAQLEGYIDAPQLRFFEFVAQNLMAPGSNVILCSPGPVWAYSRWGEQAQGFSNFAFASLIVTGAVAYEGYAPQRQHNLRLVLTGDAHHYARFVEKAQDYTDANPTAARCLAQVHYITCGLGGAFTHPTHWLESVRPLTKWRPAPPILPYDPRGGFHRDYPRRFSIATIRGGAEAIYPDRATSRAITLRNFAFLWYNPWLGLFLAGVGVFAAWLLHFGAIAIDTDLVTLLGAGSFARGSANFIRLLLHTPWPWLIIAGVVAALRYFADFADRPTLRTATGVLHGLAHVVVYCVLLVAAAAVLPGDGWVVLTMGAITGLVSPTIMGVYLIVMLNGFGRHWDEAYSALRIENFKGFLRLRIDAAGDLTVYPIVIDEVPRTDDGNLAPRYVEPPVLIRKDPCAPS